MSGFRRIGMILAAGIVSAQTATFEVVSIRRTPPERRNHLKLERCPSGGRFVSTGAPLVWSIQFAFHVADARVFGAPAWIDSFEEAYDIEAQPPAPVTESVCREMVQSMLVDRFALRAHREIREIPAYDLVVVKRGVRMQQANPNDTQGVKINGAVQQALSETEAPAGWTMARLASYLSGHPAVGRVVVDKTGLTGSWRFELSFARTETDDRPSIFAALQDQLGLKLEAGKEALEVLVIDGIAKPTEN